MAAATIWFATEDMNQVSDTQVSQTIAFTLWQHGYEEIEPLVLSQLRRQTAMVMEGYGYIEADFQVFVKRISDGYIGRTLRLAVWHGSFDDTEFSVQSQRSESFSSIYTSLPFNPSPHQL